MKSIVSSVKEIDCRIEIHTNRVHELFLEKNVLIILNDTPTNVIQSAKRKTFEHNFF